MAMIIRTWLHSLINCWMILTNQQKLEGMRPREDQINNLSVLRRLYYYYSSNLRAHGVCDYGTLPIMRQDLSSYLTIYIYKYTRPFRMVFFFALSPLNYPIASFDQEILSVEYKI